jgi:hypothetical protein
MVQQTCTCGEKYWPSQRWIHKECGVVNHQETVTTATNVVVNTDPVVVNRSRDRHKKTEGRAAYMREYMRKKRAK